MDGFNHFPPDPGMSQLHTILDIINNKDKLTAATKNFESSRKKANATIEEVNQKLAELEAKSADLTVREKALARMIITVNEDNVELKKREDAVIIGEEILKRDQDGLSREMQNGRSDVRTGLIEVEDVKKVVAIKADELDEREKAVAIGEAEMVEWKKKMRSLGVNKK